MSSMLTTKFSLRALIIFVAIVGVALGVWRVAASFIKPSKIYAIKVAVAKMPANDDAFIDWLREQPGVYRASIKRNPDSVEVVFIMNRDLNGHPPAPDLRRGLERFGYKGIGKFQYF